MEVPFQIDSALDTERVKFSGTSALIQKRGDFIVKEQNYIKVFDGEVPASSLAEVFLLFNYDRRIEGFTGHSLSVSDVITVSENAYVEAGCYFCDVFGFRRLQFDPSKTIQKE